MKIINIINIHFLMIKNLVKILTLINNYTYIQIESIN
jgi:hypothetical protein